MKIVSAKTMSETESKAYKLGSSDSVFMEQAGQGIANEAMNFIEERDLGTNILLLCGKGNNGGDAFVAGRLLLNHGFDVFAVHPEPMKNCTPLCQKNRILFEEYGGTVCNAIDDCPPCTLIIDGFFGTGFKGAIKEPYASLVEQANQCGVPILSIDIPSGLDGSTGKIEGPTIKAAKTLFLGLPKTGFFLGEGWNVVGKLAGVNFGLPASLIEGLKEDLELLTVRKLAGLLPPIKRTRHKYQAGYVIGLAGSPTMPGAALLASLAAFRGGSGMVKLLYPEGMEAQLANSPYELIKLPYKLDRPEEVLDWLEKAKATFIGPGLGRTEEVREFLKWIVPKISKPSVIDADALYFLAEEAFDLPAHMVLTPHLGEMQRLLQSEKPLELNQALMKQCQHYAEEKGATLVLKGAPTFIFHPHTPILVNVSGDPGMATGGSGDVLTGLIASLLSQGLNGRDAAALAAYMHGMAGEYRADEFTSRGMMARDLIEQFPLVYRALEECT